MRAYVMTTGTVFGLIVLAHLWRLKVEPHMAGDVWWWLITGLALALCIWAFSLVRPGRAARS